MDLAQLKTNQKNEREGVWFDVDDRTRVLVARANNPVYRELFTERVKPLRLQIRNNMVSPAALDAINAHVMARTILLGWQGLDFGAERDIPYSQDRAEQLLRDIPDFLVMISEFSQDAAAYRDQELADQGNGSAPISAGT